MKQEIIRGRYDGIKRIWAQIIWAVSSLGPALAICLDSSIQPTNEETSVSNTFDERTSNRSHMSSGWTNSRQSCQVNCLIQPYFGPAWFLPATRAHWRAACALLSTWSPTWEKMSDLSNFLLLCAEQTNMCFPHRGGFETTAPFRLKVALSNTFFSGKNSNWPHWGERRAEREREREKWRRRRRESGGGEGQVRDGIRGRDVSETEQKRANISGRETEWEEENWEERVICRHICEYLPTHILQVSEQLET